MKTFITFFIFFCIFITKTFGGCTNNPPTQPDSTFPKLSGKLVYHAYKKYGDGSSNLFLYDFTKKELIQINKPEWRIIDPMNGHISPDGKQIVFMGRKNSAWNIFIWQIGTNTPPIELTQSKGATRNEDPKFTSDGKNIVFKQNNLIKKMELTSKKITTISNSSSKTENSMPYETPDGKYIYFTAGAGASSVIYQKDLSDGSTKLFQKEENISCYYPIALDNKTILFAKWGSSLVHNDLIYSKSNSSNGPAKELPINDCLSNNSDPTPVLDHYIIFSSTSAGGYRLYLGDIKTGERWSLDSLGVNADSATAKLGSHYSNSN